MRRLYVSTHDVVHANSDLFGGVGAHYIDLVNYTSEANAQLKKQWDHNHPENTAWLALPEVVAWKASGGHVLIQATVDHREFCEDAWHGNPDVAILPHPTFEGTDKLSKHKDSPTKKLKQKHLDALAVLGITPNDTVWDVSDKAAVRRNDVKLRAIL